MDKQIVPQAGDLWKNGTRVWFITEPIGTTLSQVDKYHNDYDIVRPFEDGKNGWELVWREGWHKVIDTMHAHEGCVVATWRWEKAG